jgi:hypothetical protein
MGGATGVVAAHPECVKYYVYIVFVLVLLVLPVLPVLLVLLVLLVLPPNLSLAVDVTARVKMPID